MEYLNKELQERLNKLTPRNKELLESFLFDISKVKRNVEKKEAVMRLRSKIREIVSKEE